MCSAKKLKSTFQARGKSCQVVLRGEGRGKQVARCAALAIFFSRLVGRGVLMECVGVKKRGGKDRNLSEDHSPRSLAGMEASGLGRE